MSGLLNELNSADKGSEDKLEILRIMRMLEDKSGRNNGMVEDFMADYWSQLFTGQREKTTATKKPICAMPLSTQIGNKSVKKDLFQPLLKAFMPFAGPIKMHKQS